MIDRSRKFISMNVFSTRVNVEKETEETRSRREQRKSGRNVWFTSTSVWMKAMEVCVSRSERFFPMWQHTCILVKKKSTELKSCMIYYKSTFSGDLQRTCSSSCCGLLLQVMKELSWEGTIPRKYFSHWVAGRKILSTDRNRTVYWE